MCYQIKTPLKFCFAYFMFLCLIFMFYISLNIFFHSLYWVLYILEIFFAFIIFVFVTLCVSKQTFVIEVLSYMCLFHLLLCTIIVATNLPCIFCVWVIGDAILKSFQAMKITQGTL